MTDLTAVKAHGKINLHLQVLNRRADGFHNIFSIMAELAVCDLLKLRSFEFSDAPDQVEVQILSEGGVYSDLIDQIPHEDNLISRGVRNYLAGAGAGGKVCISVKKNIPAGAGMGGGSSDAAAAIVMVHRALGKCGQQVMFDAAAATGSDVPFFLTGGLAFAGGRGELVESAGRKLSGYVVLVNNGIEVNTGAAYRALSRGVSEEGNWSIEEKKIEFRSSLDRPESWKSVFWNDFEETVFALHPELRAVKQSMYDLGAFFAAMTGSGSTVFGVFRNRNDAESALMSLKKRGNRVFLSNFV